MVVACLVAGRVALCDDTAPPDFANLESVLQRAQSSVSVERCSARQDMLKLRGHELREFVSRFPYDSAEINSVLVWSLERILQADTGPDGELAEKGLEYLSIQNGPYSVAASMALHRNSQLRRTRAATALARLGATITYRDPVRFEQILTLPPETPGVGVGFGPASIPTAVFIHEDWRGQREDLWQLRRLTCQSGMVIYVINGAKVEINDIWSATAAWIPGVDIEQRGASLGITRNGFEERSGCGVDSVLPHSAAEKAGLLQGDLIFQVDETRISSFNELVQLLRDKRPGESVNVHLLRKAGLDESLVQVPIVLGSWRNQLDPNAVDPPPPFQGPEGVSYIELFDRPPGVPLPQSVPQPFQFR